jgi:hypothetical protein
VSPVVIGKVQHYVSKAERHFTFTAILTLPALIFNNSQYPGTMPVFGEPKEPVRDVAAKQSAM